MQQEQVNKSRKRAPPAAPGKPPAKRQATATATPTPPAQTELETVRGLLASYHSLLNGSANEEAWQALLKAAQGDVASQRLAARLLPRFIHLFTDQVEVVAGTLIKLYERYNQDQEDSDKPLLEEHTRRDALQGLQAVLLAASSGTPHGCQAVKLILTVLFRLLPQAEVEAPSTDDMTEEEGEVAPQDNATAAAHGPWVRKVLRLALQHHPVTTLTFCFGCLGTTASTSGRNANASSSSSNSGVPSVGLAVVQGVKLWLKEHILREATPSREGTPLLMDCSSDASAAAAAVNGGSAAAGAVAAAAAAGGGSGTSNGASTPRAAAAAAAGAFGQQQRGCVLQSVLQGSPELRVWVRKEAKGLSRAPEEVKAVLQAAMQLMPPERPPAATKRPYPGNGQQQQQQQRPGMPRQQQQHQQQQPPYPQPSPQQQLPQHKTPNGVAQRAVNGMDPLSRSWSTPSPGGRGPPPSSSSRGRTALGRPPDPAAAGWGQFPRPAGPICRLQPCVLLANVPWQLSLQDLQQQLQAVEAWILDQQPPPGSAAAASAGSGGGPGARACCVLKAPLDAARTYMKHHKVNRLGPQCAPTQVFFADALPACSRAAAAAGGGGGGGSGQQSGSSSSSVFVWALRAVAGDAQRVTDDLREAGLVPKSVHRVNHGADPGTVLEAHSPKEAGDMLSFLLKTHAAAIAAAAAAQQQHQDLPPLPLDPPPAAGGWTNASGTPAGGGSRGSKPPFTPSSAAAGGGVGGGAGPSSQQQQQGTPAGGFGGGPRRSNSMPTPGQQQQQQQKPGAEANWRHSPGPNQQQGGGWGGGGSTPGGPSLLQQQQSWGGSAAQQQQPWQQQGRWQSGGGGGGQGGMSSAGGFPGPPAGTLQRQHSYAGASPSGGTPTHAGSPAGGGGLHASPHMGQVPPVLPPGAHGPGGPAAAPQYAGSQVLWAGQLCKSEVPVGSVCCVAPAGPARTSGQAPEPLQWPDSLHINHRINVADALEHYNAAPPHARAVRLLLPVDSPPNNVAAIQSFGQYLTSKGRAGMVRLPAGNGLSARAVYIIVPRPTVCETLRVAWDGRGVMLIVVVVPQGGGGGGSSGGGAAGGGGGGHNAALPGPPGGGGGPGGMHPPMHQHPQHYNRPNMR